MSNVRFIIYEFNKYNKCLCRCFSLSLPSPAELLHCVQYQLLFLISMVLSAHPMGTQVTEVFFGTPGEHPHPVCQRVLICTSFTTHAHLLLRVHEASLLVVAFLANSYHFILQCDCVNVVDLIRSTQNTRCTFQQTMIHILILNLSFSSVCGTQAFSIVALSILSILA